MDQLPRGRRWRSRPILLGLLLVVALAATLALAPAQARTSVQVTARALASWLHATLWAWPLAAALTLAVLTNPPARRRWPRPTHRLPPAIGSFVVLVALTGLATASRPRVGLLVVGVVVAVGLLAAWVVLVPRRLVDPARVTPRGDVADAPDGQRQGGGGCQQPHQPGAQVVEHGAKVRRAGRGKCPARHSQQQPDRADEHDQA